VLTCTKCDHTFCVVLLFLAVMNLVVCVPSLKLLTWNDFPAEFVKGNGVKRYWLVGVTSIGHINIVTLCQRTVSTGMGTIVRQADHLGL